MRSVNDQSYSHLSIDFQEEHLLEFRNDIISNDGVF